MSTCQSLLRVRCSVFYLSSLIFFLIIPSGLKVQDFPSNTAWTTCYNQLCLQCPHVLLQQLVSRSLSSTEHAGRKISITFYLLALHRKYRKEAALLPGQRQHYKSVPTQLLQAEAAQRPRWYSPMNTGVCFGVACICPQLCFTSANTSGPGCVSVYLNVPPWSVTAGGAVGRGEIGHTSDVGC